MKILFITSTRLGDAVLSTGALNHFVEKYPESETTVACGPLVSGLFEAYPSVVRVIALKKEKYALHWFKLWKETKNTKWDIIVDLRNSLLSRLLSSKKKYIWGNNKKNKKHKVEQIAELIKVSPPPAPKLYFNEEMQQTAQFLIPDDLPVLAIGPAANWPGKTWPSENFIILIKKLIAEDGILPKARVAIFAAPNEEEIANKVLNAFPLEQRIDIIGKVSPQIAAAALQRCSFYIGNDSGLMHTAAAVGTPTLGLFGPSWPYLYHPWGDHCAYVSTPETYDELINFPGYKPDNTAPSLMTSLKIDPVYKAAIQLWGKVSTSGD